jgi:hypothetical protein
MAVLRFCGFASRQLLRRCLVPFTDRTNMVGGFRGIGVCDSDPYPLAYPSLLGRHRASLLRKNMQADGHSADRVMALAYGQVPSR